MFEWNHMRVGIIWIYIYVWHSGHHEPIWYVWINARISLKHKTIILLLYMYIFVCIMVCLYVALCTCVDRVCAFTNIACVW